MSTAQVASNELATTDDFQMLVEGINAILCMDTDVEANVVSSTHQKYNQAVREVNKRLKQCDAMMQKGLRAEALEQAQIEPTLLDVVSILDFDEQDIWNDYAQQCGFPRVPELLVEVVDDLQTAWAAEEPLTDLRYRHRLHALARSPLPIRIDILRQLAKVDQSNPLWVDELQIYEKARLADVLEECKAAATANDLNRIAALEAELKSSEWRVPPSKKLVAFVAARSQEVQCRHARAHLAKLEPQLNEAYSLSDVETGRRLREEWGQHAGAARLSGEDALMAKVMEPFKWLAEKDRQEREEAAYQAAVQDLERALDRKNATKEDFEPLYYKIEQFGLGIPEGLQQRLANRVADMDQNTTRQRRLKITGIAAALATVLLLIGVIVFLAMRSSNLASKVAILQGYLDKNQIEDARSEVVEIESNEPYVFEHEDYQAQIRILEGKENEEKQRLQSIKDGQAQIRLAIKTLTEDQTATSLESKTVSQGFKAVNLVLSITKTTAEKRSINTLVTELEHQWGVVQTLVDDKYRKEVAALAQEVEDLDPGLSSYETALRNKIPKAETLKSRTVVSPGLGAELADPILARISELINSDKKAREESRSLARIRNAIGNPSEYRAQLDAYVKNPEYSGNNRAQDFQSVLSSEYPLWTDFEKWSQLKQDLQGANLATYRPAAASTRLAAIQKVIQDQKGFPDLKQLQTYADYLDVLVLRDKKTMQGQIQRLLNADPVAGLYLVETSDGKYYTKKEPMATSTATSVPVQVALDTSLGGGKLIRFPVKDIKNPPGPNGEKFDFTSPQFKFSQKAKAYNDKAMTDPNSWETEYLNLLGLLYHDKEIDPILRYDLTFVIQQEACKGSPYLQKALAKNVQTLKNVQSLIPVDANWVAPDDEKAKTARRNAQDALGKLTDPSEAKTGLPAYLAGLKIDQIGNNYVWVGWLHRNSKNDWVVSYKSSSLPAELKSLHVITRSSSFNPVQFPKIGEVKDKKTSVTLSDRSSLLKEGRPVFEQQ